MVSAESDPGWEPGLQGVPGRAQHAESERQIRGPNVDPTRAVSQPVPPSKADSRETGGQLAPKPKRKPRRHQKPKGFSCSLFEALPGTAFKAAWPLRLLLK